MYTPKSVGRWTRIGRVGSAFFVPIVIVCCSNEVEIEPRDSGPSPDRGLYRLVGGRFAGVPNSRFESAEFRGGGRGGQDVPSVEMRNDEYRLRLGSPVLRLVEDER